MKITAFRRLAPFATGIFLGLFSQTIFAQYVWIDEKGVKQFSDMPPSANVPQNRILKQPGASSRTAPAFDAGDASVKPAAQPKTSSSTAEQNADFKKRHAEQSEKDKKIAEKARQDSEKAAYCERVRAYQRDLASGERIAKTEPNGERAYLTDEQREREMANAQSRLAECN